MSIINRHQAGFIKNRNIMPQSFNKIWIHAIWATKKRVPLLHQNIEQTVYQFISEQLREQGCPVRIINGMPDHIHCFLTSARFSKNSFGDT